MTCKGEKHDKISSNVSKQKRKERQEVGDDISGAEERKIVREKIKEDVIGRMLSFCSMDVTILMYDDSDYFT